MPSPIDFAEKNVASFIESLKTLVRIPSISFDGFPKEEVRRSAHAVVAHLKECGLENVEILEVPNTHPYVYADWLHAPGKPTILLYAHHDVQPTGRTELWKSPPFEPVERDGRLWGRGTADDKAGVVVHSSAIFSYLQTHGKLPVNVKMLIEGEEEIGSEHLEHFLELYKHKMSADVMVLTDTGNYDTGVPTITTSLRGLVAIEVEVKAMERPVHSGQWGGAVPDPVIALSKMIATLVDDNGNIAISGVCDDVLPLNDLEKESLKKINFTAQMYRKQAGVLPKTELIGGAPQDPLVAMTRLPSLSVNAIEASSRKRAANIINESAWCKIGIRTVPNMNEAKVQKLLVDHLKKVAPWGVEVNIKADATGPWWVTNPQGKAFEIAAKALTKAFGKECVFMGCGGSIPFVGPFAKVLGGVPALLIGVEDPYTNAHSENESMDLGDFRKAILGAIYFYEEIAKSGL